MYDNLMIDIETTGVNASWNAMIQVAAVPFNLLTCEADYGMAFVRCLKIPENRVWSKSTSDWWNKTNPDMLDTILENGLEPMDVMMEFYKYVGMFGKYVKFWSNHTIDWEMVDSYFKVYTKNNPFMYYGFRDLDSYAEALYPSAVFKNKPRYNNDSRAHDAFEDCKRQIEWLFKMRRILQGKGL